ncbi:transmembrane protein 220 [Hoplias malabaricus]|uniref:transmembrane protein 220 n=1 Tax=Hoplias malabaricus TaxID=27720 RepID=UPI0034637B2A
MGKNKTEFIVPLWRGCNLLMSAFFALATYVQINDPDAGFWMVGYAIPAGLCFLISCHPQITETLPWRRVADLHVMVATGFGAILGWTLYKEGVTHIFHQEEGREFCGLMLTVLWLLLCRHSGRGGVGVLRLCTAVGIAVFPFVAWIYYYINKELRADWPEHCTTAL